jgi:hypothetical protein
MRTAAGNTVMALEWAHELQILVYKSQNFSTKTFEIPFIPPRRLPGGLLKVF